MMSSETGFDFASQIDCCGGNMWFWHRKMTEANEGLKLIKPAEKVLSLSDLPSNWRDHIEVVTRRRAKVRVSAELKDENVDPFQALTSARRIVTLDATHKEIIDELCHSGFTTIWVPDHHLLQTHTKGLEKVALEPGKIQGIFKTNSNGNHPQTPNCFMFPLDKGGWRVYRFSPGIQEDPTWNQDKEGWTNCYFNCKPNLATAAKSMGGQEDPDHGGFVFWKVENAQRVAETLGQKIVLPDALLRRKARLKAHRDGRLIMHISKKPDEKSTLLPDWISKGNRWVRLFDVLTNPKGDDVPRITIPRISCAELDNGSYALEYLVDGILLAGHPCIVGGAKKTLKTTILIALALSLATGKLFLGRFSIKRSCKVIILSGESGLPTIQETARRICAAMNIQLAEIENLLWSTFIPRLDNADHLDALDRLIKETGCEVVAIDPTYLALGGSDAGNVFVQGEKLRAGEQSLRA